MFGGLPLHRAQLAGRHPIGALPDQQLGITVDRLAKEHPDVSLPPHPIACAPRRNDRDLRQRRCRRRSRWWRLRLLRSHGEDRSGARDGAAQRIAHAGAGFQSITESIDTTTPAGRMMMQMVGAFAEFERAMIRERTSAGIAAARAEGRVGGRRKKLDAAKRREIAESVITGRKSGAEMARLYNISQPTVSRIVAQHRVDSP